MIVTSMAAWLALLAVILLASAAGYTLIRLLPWSSAARLAGVPGITGVALAPFLLGGGSVLVLGFLPGSSHTTHLTLVVTGLAVLIALTVWHRGTLGVKKEAATSKVFGEYLFSALLALWLLMLFINSIFLPLLQNDALEYATVGRLLYETRALSSYPAINPEQSASGFFGPWTHPPLYVSLIYLTQVIQGHADEPGFMRLIAPWVVTCATLLVLTLGSIISRLTGLIAAVIFLSTPLLFTGADSALIDALPVLGICLVATAILCIEARPVVRGGVVGAALALALWTHSQAVLFLPLTVWAIALQNGRRGLRSTVQETVSLVGVALLFGSWPYWRNLQIFGSLISDNPAVFALPSLDWHGYFATSRGLDNWLAVLQYGLLKGWFSLEAYGWAFWLMILGAMVVFNYFLRPTWWAILCDGGRKALDPDGQVLWVSLTLVLGYLIGVLASILAGLDLMIKNERYMLVILPFVAILAGYGSQVVLARAATFAVSSENSSWKRDALAAAGVAITLVLLLQLFVIAGYYRWRHAPPKIKLTITGTEEIESYRKSELFKSRFRRGLEMFPNISAMYWVRENLPLDALVLSLRPADMYYAQRKMVSYLDERLLPIYKESSPQAAAKMLLDLGVTHLHVPDYGLPVSYNSVLDRIIADPELSRLLHMAGGTQILELRTPVGGEAKPIAFESVDFSPGNHVWTKYLQINLGGRKALNALGVTGETLTKDGASDSALSVPIFHRDFSTILVNGLGSPLLEPRIDSLLQVRGGREYRVRFDLEGRAFIRIWLVQFDARGLVLSQSRISEGPERIAEIVLNESAGSKCVSRRFFALPEAAYVRFGIEHVGHSKVTVKQAVLEFVADKTLEGP
jgi:hypothetical protein